MSMLRAFPLLMLLLPIPTRAECPTVPVPSGIDPGDDVEVRARIATGAEGRVVRASDWEGPDDLVQAVRATLSDCRLEPSVEQLRIWLFSRPPVHVAGEVRQGGTRVPVSGLRIRAGDRIAITDEHGRFAFRNLDPGSVILQLADDGWRLLDEPELTIRRDERTEITLWVAPNTRHDELVARYRARAPTSVVRVVDLDEAVGIPGTLGDPLRLLAAEAGLARSPYDAGWLLVRGADFDQVGLFLDGVRVPLIYHLGGFTSVLHPEMVEAVQFWPGLFPARFGAATSGAVDVVPRRVGDRARAVGGVNLVFAHAFAETPTRWGGLALAARRSYLDGVLALAVGREGARIAPRFWDVQARATIGPHAVTFLTIADALDAPSVDGDGTLLLEQRAAQVQARLRLDPATDLRLWLAWSRRDLSGATAPRQLTELQPGFRIERGGSAGPDGRWTVGLEAQLRRFKTQRQTQERDAPAFTTDPYVGLQLGDPVTVWSEARLETLYTPDQLLRTGFSPRGGVRWQASHRLELHTEAGSLHQPPPADFLLGLSEGVYFGLESSSQINVGFSVTDPRGRIAVDAFHRRAEDLVGLEADGSLGPGGATASGVETTLQGRVDGFEATLLVQGVRATRSEDQARLAETRKLWAYDQPYRLELRAAQALPRDWTLAVRFRAGGGFPRFEGRFGREPTEAYDILLQRVVDLGLDANDTRLAPFHSLDLRVAHTITFRAWRLQASLDLQNVYNRRVVEPAITGFGEAQPSYGFGLPILPIFGIEGEFWPGRVSTGGSLP